MFLTVMKHKEAYPNTLRIILDEPDILIREVKVEQVVLNKSGKRAIRLDAWAVSELPSTTIIFITQDDIFGKNRYQ